MYALYMDLTAPEDNSAQMGDPNTPAINAMKEALRRRKLKLIDDGSVAADPTYSSAMIEDSIKT